MGRTGALHGVWTLTPVVRGVVAVAGGDDITGRNWSVNYYRGEGGERGVEERVNLCTIIFNLQGDNSY